MNVHKHGDYFQNTRQAVSMDHATEGQGMVAVRIWLTHSSARFPEVVMVVVMTTIRM